MKPSKPIPNDPDDDISLEEIEAAADETPASTIAPEVDVRTEHLTAWDESPASTGSAAPKVLPEDEKSVVEELIEKGVNEAERMRRMAAADPDFEP